MILLALLLQAAAAQAAPVQSEPDGPDILVRAPLPATQQVPATMVVEPAAMLIAACDRDGDAETSRFELNECLAKSVAGTPGVKDGVMRYIAYGDWALKWLGDRAALPSPYEVDRNADDQVTLTELQDHFGRLFARYDRDRDGQVSRAELLTFKTMPIGANGPANAPPPGDRKPPHEGGKPRR